MTPEDRQKIEALLAWSLLERTKDPRHGDYTSTMALKLAKLLGVDARQLAERVVERLNEKTDT